MRRRRFERETERESETQREKEREREKSETSGRKRERENIFQRTAVISSKSIVPLSSTSYNANAERAFSSREPLHRAESPDASSVKSTVPSPSLSIVWKRRAESSVSSSRLVSFPGALRAISTRHLQN